MPTRLTRSCYLLLDVIEYRLIYPNSSTAIYRHQGGASDQATEKILSHVMCHMTHLQHTATGTSFILRHYKTNLHQ